MFGLAAFPLLSWRVSQGRGEWLGALTECLTTSKSLLARRSNPDALDHL